MRAVALRRPHLSLGMGPQIVVVVLVLGLTGAMAIEPTRQLLEQRDRIAQATAELKRTRATNERLAAYLERLRDPDYLEQQARAQLGLVRPGETTYVVMPPSKKARARVKPRPGRAGRAVATAEPSFVERLLEFIGVS